MNEPSTLPTDTPAVRIRQRLLYGAGGLLDHWGVQGVKASANIVLNVVLGVNPMVVGFIMMVARIWDAVTDPVMGGLTDRTRTRWGRRRPYIVLGAILSMIFFPLLWIFPAGLSPAATSVWILIAALLFYTTFTIFSVPYHALAYELGPHDTNGAAFIASRIIMSTPCVFLIQYTFTLTQVGWFGNPRQSVHLLAVLYGLLFGGLALLPGFLLKERSTATADTAVAAIPVAQRAPATSILKMIQAALRFRGMRLLLIATFASSTIITSVNVLLTYVTIYYCFGGDTKAAAIMLGYGAFVFGGSMLILTPLAERLGRIGTINGLMIAYGCGMLASLAKWWAFNPIVPWTQLLLLPLLLFSALSITLLQETLVGQLSIAHHPELTDHDNGIFTAIYSWSLKAGNAIAMAISGILLVSIGFDAALGGSQSSLTILLMRVIFTFIPFIGLATAAWCVLRISEVPHSSTSSLKPKQQFKQP